MLRCSLLLGLSGRVRGGLLWLRQAGLLAYAAGSTLVLQSLADGQQQLLQQPGRLAIGALAVSADGSLLATGAAAPGPGGCADVVVWHVASRTAAHMLRQHPTSCQLLSFSPDGAWLLSLGGSSLVLWELASGRAAAIGSTSQVRVLAATAYKHQRAC